MITETMFVARTTVRLKDSVSLKTGDHVGLQHPEGEHAVRDVEPVRWHAALHEEVDRQDTVSEQVCGDRHHESQEHSLDVYTEQQKLVPRKRKS